MKILVEAELINEESSGNPGDQDADASANPEVTKDQYAESIDHREGPEDQDTDTGDYTKVPEYQDAESSSHTEGPGAGDRDDGNTHRTPYYFSKMDIDVKNIDKNDTNVRRTIYKAIDDPYF